MLMDFNSLVAKYKMNITGVLHLGAHLAEEAALYHENSVTNVWWVEGNPIVMPKLKKRLAKYPCHKLVEALVYSEDGVDLNFNVTNYDGMSSSILEFGTHPQFSPDTIFVDKVQLKSKTVDTLVAENNISGVNLLNMDLQGAELHCVKGATEFLQGVDYILTEVNKAQVYIGAAQVKELDQYLVDFQRVETYWVPGQGWGDGLYIRRGL